MQNWAHIPIEWREISFTWKLDNIVVWTKKKVMVYYKFFLKLHKNIKNLFQAFVI